MQPQLVLNLGPSLTPDFMIGAHFHALLAWPTIDELATFRKVSEELAAGTIRLTNAVDADVAKAVMGNWPQIDGTGITARARKRTTASGHFNTRLKQRMAAARAGIGKAHEQIFGVPALLPPGITALFLELTGQLLLDNWHIQLLCAEVDRLRTTPNTRLAIALPPRSLKSIIVSVALPAWLLGHDPGIEIVCVSYGQELSDQLSSDRRRIMLTPWYRRLFPATRLDRQAVGHLATTLGGKRYATSVGGALTGIGADVIIVDDPMKPDDALSDAERTRANAWARHTLFTRLNQKADDRIIIVQQRLHEADMIGHVMDIAGFELLSFPAIAQDDEHHTIRTPFGTLMHTRKAGEALHPERESLEVLHKQRTLLGTGFFAAQYLQSPTPPGGGLIKVDWFHRYDLNRKPAFTRVFQSWDCAAKASQLADHSVCTTWGVTYHKEVHLLHVYRARLEYPDLKRKLRELAEHHRAGVVLIEDPRRVPSSSRNYSARVLPASRPSNPGVTKSCAWPPRPR